MRKLKPKKMGRPPSDNPKNTQVVVRLDREDAKKLDENAEFHGETKTESIRRGIREVNKAIKK